MFFGLLVIVKYIARISHHDPPRYDVARAGIFVVHTLLQGIFMSNIIKPKPELRTIRRITLIATGMLNFTFFCTDIFVKHPIFSNIPFLSDLFSTATMGLRFLMFYRSFAAVSASYQAPSQNVSWRKKYLILGIITGSAWSLLSALPYLVNSLKHFQKVFACGFLVSNCALAIFARIMIIPAGPNINTNGSLFILTLIFTLVRNVAICVHDYWFIFATAATVSQTVIVQALLFNRKIEVEAKWQPLKECVFACLTVQNLARLFLDMAWAFPDSEHDLKLSGYALVGLKVAEMCYRLLVVLCLGKNIVQPTQSTPNAGNNIKDNNNSEEKEPLLVNPDGTPATSGAEENV
mmetsp:Transcript_14133/g.19685  ORF Transcript_14133/g.19685 Transcript_14133/m.19685 type:complete len:349 (-) Transcript_14133:41-1087(-)